MPLLQTVRQSVQSVKLALQKQSRERAQRIRDARTLHVPESFLEIRSLTQTDDDNLEQFLRRNNLTDALHVYLESQAIRNA